MKELKGVNRWYALGLNLGVEISTLDGINKEAIQTRKIEMLKRWIKLKPKAAWEDVVSALSEMDEKRVAEHIRENYCADGQGVHVAPGT